MLARIAVLLTLVAVTISGQGLKERTDLRMAGDLCLTRMSQGRFGDGLKVFDTLSRRPKQVLEAEAYQNQDKLSDFSAKFGRGVGYEFAREIMLSESYVRLSYLLKFDSHPILINLDFYRPDSVWIYDGVSWTADPSEMFPR